MWTDSTLQPIQDGAPYIAIPVPTEETDEQGNIIFTDAVQYPGNYPKEEIPGLFPVTLTDEPFDPSLVVTGFTIDSSHTQVWATRSKTAEEIADYRASISSSLANRRYEVSTGGTTVGGISIQTDPQSQSSLMGAYIMASQNSGYSVEWKTPNGFVTLNAATIVALGNAVAAFVQKCFNAEAMVTASISNYNTPAEVVAAFDSAMA